MTAIKRTFALAFSSLLLAAMLLAGCSGAGQETSAASSASSAASASQQAQAVAVNAIVEVDASAAQDAGMDISSINEIAGPAEYGLGEGATAYDALVATGATLDEQPGYVVSINGVGETSGSASGGWMYSVNGEDPTVAANEYVLSDGDTVRWYYSYWS